MNLVQSPLASIPSPSVSQWSLGPLPIRAYALCIILGIFVAILVANRRLTARGGAPWLILDVAVWAVPFGIVGARIYHVITSPDNYFGAGGDLVRALYIWEGGLGIWGAVAGGALGAWLACKRMGVPFAAVADSLAVGLPLAQAVGRLGNWFNNELYGKRADDLPWGLQVHQMRDGHAVADVPGLYHPTFLYELLWNLGTAGLVYLLDRRFKFGRGRAFALYVMAYTLGRVWIEMLRIDDENTVTMFLGQRLNVWTSVVVFLGAAVYFLLRRGPREYLLPVEPDADSGPYRVVDEAEFLAARETGADGDGDGTAPTADATPADDGDPGAETDDPSPVGGADTSHAADRDRD